MMSRGRAVAIALGAVAGAGLRWVVTTAAGSGGTDASLLVVNVLGTAVLALFASEHPWRIPTRARALLTAGFCGAVTTWSSLAVRTASELDRGRLAAPLGWLLVNLAAGIAVAAMVRSAMQRRVGADSHRGTP